MSNIYKILLVKKNKLQKNKELLPCKNLLNLKDNEIEKLKNAKKGQIYVHIQENDYLFYQYNGKSWLEIK